jgi:hypothetical protein
VVDETQRAGQPPPCLVLNEGRELFWGIFMHSGEPLCRFGV